MDEENNKPSGSADIEGFERRPKIEIPDDYEEIIEIPDTIEVPGIIEISDDEDITERDAQNFENCTLNDLKIKQEQLRIAYEKELMNNNAHGEPEGDGPSPIVDPTPAPTSDPTPITPQLDQMSFSDDSNIETDDEMSEEQLRKLTEQEKGRPLKRRDKVLYQLLDKVAKLESEMEEMRNGKNNQKSRSHRSSSHRSRSHHSRSHHSSSHRSRSHDKNRSSTSRDHKKKQSSKDLDRSEKHRSNVKSEISKDGSLHNLPLTPESASFDPLLEDETQAVSPTHSMNTLDLFPPMIKKPNPNSPEAEFLNSSFPPFIPNVSSNVASATPIVTPMTSYSESFSSPYYTPAPRPNDNWFHHVPQPHPPINHGNSIGNLKNTNPNIYLSNPKAKTCVLCGQFYQRITNHYRKNHSNDEVFVSRLSPQMANELKSGSCTTKASTLRKGSFKVIKAMCCFCEAFHSHCNQPWLTHIRSCTGEYLDKCHVCEQEVNANKHCNVETAKPEERHDLFSKDLMAFICSDCNYIQLSEDNLKKHLKNQHGIATPLKDANYMEVTLLPSFRSIIYAQNRVANAEGGQSNDVAGPSRIQVLEDIWLPPVNIPQASQAKREIGWKEKCYPHYANEQGCRYDVRPWMENQHERFTKSLEKLPLTTQFALYKCMHPQCTFATNKGARMFSHMGEHFDLLDYGMDDFWSKHPDDEKSREVAAQIKQYHNKCLGCAYCDAKPFKSSKQLWDHMNVDHQSCNFQCEYCFYRCMELDAIVLHYQEHHNNCTRDILTCDGYRKLTLSLFECMEENRTQNERPDHTDKFECIHCEYTSNNISLLRSHMANHHPNQFMFVFPRDLNVGIQSWSPDPCTYLYIGGSFDNSAFTFYKCKDDESLEYKKHELDLESIAYNSNEPDVQIKVKCMIPPHNNLLIDDDVRIVNYFVREAHGNVVMQRYLCGQHSPAELIKEYGDSNENAFCVICATFIEVDKNAIGNAYIEHVSKHCKYTSATENDMLKHIHKAEEHKDSINKYTLVEYCGNKMVKKETKCTYSCNMHGNKIKIGTQASISKHFMEMHAGQRCNIDIEQDITILESNDDRQPEGSTYSKIDFMFTCIYICLHNECDKFRAETEHEIRIHHLQKHAGTQENFALKNSLKKKAIIGLQ